ncbi:Receptor-like protein kinase HSL1 [Hordeum vulgare]|nr:Receptor-like protein kinase HSL1 [Hordeum vulgare]
MPKRLRCKTNLENDEKHDAASFALQETLEGVMTQKEVLKERRSKGKEQWKIYLEFQSKKFEIEEAAKRRKLDMEEASQAKKLVIEAIDQDGLE